MARIRTSYSRIEERPVIELRKWAKANDVILPADISKQYKAFKERTASYNRALGADLKAGVQFFYYIKENTYAGGLDRGGNRRIYEEVLSFSRTKAHGKGEQRVTLGDEKNAMISITQKWSPRDDRTPTRERDIRHMWIEKIIACYGKEDFFNRKDPNGEIHRYTARDIESALENWSKLNALTRSRAGAYQEEYESSDVGQRKLEEFFEEIPLAYTVYVTYAKGTIETVKKEQG